MAIQIGRLRNVAFGKRGVVPTVPITSGTFITPVTPIRFLPPWAWHPSIALLESPAIAGRREIPLKAVKGAATITAQKANVELEPSDCIASMLMAAFGTDIVNGDGLVTPYAHNFECLESAQLPCYDFWHDEGDKQWGFAAMMCNKLDLILAKAAMCRLETEWTGLYEVDGLAYSAPTAVTPRPIPFATVDATLGGSLVTGLSTAHLTIENAVTADHTLRSDTNYASRLWTEHMQVTAAMEAFFEDATEYNKFLSASSPSTPTDTSLLLKIASPETFVEAGTHNYTFLFQILSMLYRTAEVQLPAGVVKMSTTGVALPSTGSIGSGGNAHAYADRSLVAQFLNGVPTAY